MPDFEISQDYFSNHNPLAISDAGARVLREKHDIVLHWDNPHFRDKHGKRGHRSVDRKDPFFSDVKNAISTEDFDVEETEDGKIHCGDLVLAYVPGARADFNNAKRHALAQRQQAKVSRGSELSDSLRAPQVPGMENVEVGTTELRQTRGGETKVQGVTETGDGLKVDATAFIGSDISDATRRSRGRRGKS